MISYYHWLSMIFSLSMEIILLFDHVYDQERDQFGTFFLSDSLIFDFYVFLYYSFSVFLCFFNIILT